jgi:hypothetical protein
MLAKAYLDFNTPQVRKVTVIRYLKSGYTWVTLGGVASIKVHYSRLTHLPERGEHVS